MSDRIALKLECVGRINGQICTVTGDGSGSVKEGRFALNLRFSSIPKGYSISAAALWTCCSTPSFAIEQNGALNMITLAHGKYRCERTFDFGRFGAYDYNYELRLSEEENLMRATGLIEGNLNLPPMKFVDESFSEIMIPVAPNEIRSFVTANFKAVDGSDVPVKVIGKYSPLDTTYSWGCSREVLEGQRNQVRTSFIQDLHTEDVSLSLKYLTVVRGIDTPAIPKQELEALVSRQTARD
jgi:hypothetical protein